MKTKAPPPLDVKLMNVAATVLFFACGAMLLAALGWWALRHRRTPESVAAIRAGGKRSFWTFGYSGAHQTFPRRGQFWP